MTLCHGIKPVMISPTLMSIGECNIIIIWTNFDQYERDIDILDIFSENGKKVLNQTRSLWRDALKKAFIICFGHCFAKGCNSESESLPTSKKA